MVPIIFNVVMWMFRRMQPQHSIQVTIGMIAPSIMIAMTIMIVMTEVMQSTVAMIIIIILNVGGIVVISRG